MLYVITQLALIALVAMGPRTLADSAGWPGGVGTAATVAGYVLVALGALLSVAGTRALGSNLTPMPSPREGGTLVQSGPYRLVRHPIYAGLILVAAGWGLWVNGELTLLWAAVLFVLLDAKTRIEERMLAAKFDDYATYQQRVKKLIPFLY